MQFSEYWLRTFVDPQMDSAALGHLLTMAGLEVEEMEPAAPAFSGIVVGHILTTEPHPNADKLRVCRVDVGRGEPLQIVCGAPNAAPDLKVPCALVGAELPDFKIKEAKLRGVPSFGMLCSAKELGVSDEHGGLLVLPPDAPVGVSVRELLGLDDTLFTIKLTPNRADCLSLLGVAREVAALTGAALSQPDCTTVPAVHDLKREIVLSAPEACPRYLGRVIRGVDGSRPTPDWMKQRLQRSGIRSINALVDITNFVMLELGQPLHAFDNDKLDGAIQVRFPGEGESLLLLNEQKITPPADALLIADAKGPLALAGIMGGELSGVTTESTSIFLESAFFAPVAIAGRARELGFSSDASHRFERGVDFELPRLAAERATRLILEICGGEAGPVVEACDAAHLPQRAAVVLRPERVRRLLGIAIDDARIEALLEGVHLHVARGESGLTVTPPSFRFDIEIEEDLVEEVVRLFGYDNIPTPPPRGALQMLPVTESARSHWDVRHLLAGRDYQEVVTFSFVEEAWERDFCANPDPIRLANPIASQMSVMRSSLIGGLVANLAGNRKRQHTRVRTFEVGRCFLRGGKESLVPGYEQPVRVAVLASGPVQPEQWGNKARNVDFYDVKSDLEALFAPRLLRFERTVHPALHPGRSARVMLDEREIGVIGELHPVWVQQYDLGPAPVLFEVDLAAALEASQPQASEISRFPSVTRDLALVVDQGVEADVLRRGLLTAAPAIVRRLDVFDLYQGSGVEPGKKSIAFRVLMQDTQRTLEDVEVDAAIEALIRCAGDRFAAHLR